MIWMRGAAGMVITILIRQIPPRKRVDASQGAQPRSKIASVARTVPAIGPHSLLLVYSTVAPRNDSLVRPQRIHIPRQRPGDIAALRISAEVEVRRPAGRKRCALRVSASLW